MKYYKRKLVFRMVWWWVWWSILLLAVIGWTADLATGMHPFPWAIISLISVITIVLIVKIPRLSLLLEKDLKNEKYANYSELFILEKRVREKRLSERKTSEKYEMEQYKKTLNKELDS